MERKPVDRRLLTIMLIVFVQMVGAAMILPILPLYAQREFAMQPQVITLLGSAFFAAQFLAGPYLGRLSDQHGRLPILILSQIGTAISFIMLALAPNAAWLFAARLLDGITGGNIIVAQAYITDITPKEERTQSLGYIFAIFGLGFIIGPAVGGLLAAVLSVRAPYLIAAGAAILTVILTWFTLDESLPPEQRQSVQERSQSRLGPLQVLGNIPLVFILIVAFVGQFAMGMLQATFALYGEAVLFAGLDDSLINLGVGLTLAMVGIGQVFTQVVLLKRMVKRFGDARLVVLGTILRAIGLGLFAVVASIWLGIFSAMFFAVGMGLMMPALQSLATRSVADEMRGGVLGVYQSMVSLATIISTAIAGMIFAFNVTAPFWVGSVLSVLALFPALPLLKRFRYEPEPARVGSEQV
jgi:DHA1 family tetracycline resistance protein-like MFS transporter